MKKCFPWVATLVWVASVSAGFGVLLVYDYTPGADTRVAAHWPFQSKIAQDAVQPTLIMFAHPKCPCTRASIGELAILMAHRQHRVNASVIFFRPKGSLENWAHSGLWRSAEMIPGVSVRSDEGGAVAACFGATTSGTVVLYNVDGNLVFSGGITSSRGHSGDNTGRAAIMKLLNHETAATHKTPVFGCSLLNPVCAQ
jgi:hypothetical protein